jgi:thymidylate synthase (FAD)
MKVEVLTPRETLLEHLRTIETAGRTCYQSFKGPITVESARKFCAMLLRRGHEAMIEHSSMTVRFSDVSRGETHEAVRHRICSFAQESTRYVDEKDAGFVLAPLMRDDPEAIELASHAMDPYRQMRKKYKPEDARQFLPIGVENEIVMTTNYREWRTIAKLRTAEVAHWEIRSAMVQLIDQVRDLLSPIFDEFVFTGVCRSGVPFRKQDEVTFSRHELELLNRLISAATTHTDPDTQHDLTPQQLESFVPKAQLLGLDAQHLFNLFSAVKP